MKVELSREAQYDLQDIQEYTLETWGEEQKDEYLGSIFDRLSEIQSDALSVRWRLRNDIFKGCQAASVGKHLIIFLVREDQIWVSRIIHQQRDFPPHIFPLR